ncbi:DUF3977 family protein [Streptococcus sp.]|uniref:DUF3977 family protein n=1 Tax=Streptococcus sp. TaxID=1306 RepID=UPI00359F510C
MKKYIEFGFGNNHLVRTEFEHADGSEFEMKGIVGKIKPVSLYLRMWLGKSVWVCDSKEGFKRTRKNRKTTKFILGIVSEV